MICLTQTTDWPQASCKNQNNSTNVVTITLLNFILVHIIIYMGLCFRSFLEYLLFSTQVHSDWLTSFGQTSVKFKVYSLCRYFQNNQIEELPFEVFNNNLELTRLWVIYIRTFTIASIIYTFASFIRYTSYFWYIGIIILCANWPVLYLDTRSSETALVTSSWTQSTTLFPANPSMKGTP